MDAPKEKAFDIAVSGHNLFLGGQAGTGKTHLLGCIRDHLVSMGKRVAVTCTTGIGCSSISARCLPKTIHSWSGIDDGRYESSYIRDVVRNYKKEKHEEVLQTDVLIVDEVSMLSMKLFEQLEAVCSLKCDSLLFGGMQIIFSGDFYQLPPVRNSAYNDDGSFCFESNLFDKVFQHRVILDKVLRQTDEKFIRCVNDVSRGILSDESKALLQSLERPFDDDIDQSIKLYSTNDLVNDYNRHRILNMPGDHFEYTAIDKGDDSYLRKVLAPQKLWLKEGCPVILLRNLSTKLVNGLRGTVISCGQSGPVVSFPGVGITTTLHRETFTVYSPTLRQNVAARTQIPLKLAFALTVHKAQGLTLKRVEIDCRNMFSPGQLGVAIGRVTSPSGLRVINFTEDVCLPQPSKIDDFFTFTSQPDIEDKSCCRIVRVTTKDREQTLPSTCALATEVIERQEELVEDDSIDDTVLSTIMCSSESDNPPESEIPQGFDVCVVLEDLIIKEICTKAQHETNDTINELITNHKESVSEFCSGEFMYIRDMIEVLQINENDPKPVQGEKMTELYKNCQKHQTSTCYRARTYLMFFDMQAVSQQVMAHICFNITTSIRKFLLKEKELLYKVGEHGMQKRQVTTESQGKIRYVGGYCVAKLRQKYHKQTSMYCFRSEEGDQFKYEQAKTLCQLLDGLSLKEHIVEKTTSFPKTLIETSIRQNVTRGLTSISDRFFHFFIAVCERCLALLVEKNLNVHGEQLFQMCIREITIDRELHEEFVKCVASNKYADFVPDENISYVMHEMLNTVSAMDQLFSEFVDKFLMVMLNQFRKDFLSCLTVKKKMAHRKQIQVSKTSHKGVISKVNFDFILNDQSPGKSVSNNFLKGFICQDTTFLNCMKKQELLTLCKAYDCLTKSKDNKGAIIQRLNSAILKSKETIPKHQILSEQDIPIETVTESQSTVASSPTASCSTQSEYCIVCNKIEGHRQWIQCEKCNGWLHRDCAGLKQQKKWGAIAKKNAVFSCQKCTE